MKKILSILLMLLVVCSFVFADGSTSPTTDPLSQSAEKTVKVTGKVEAGSGSEKGDGDVTFGGVNIAVAIAKDSNGYLTSAPSSWDAEHFVTVTTDTPVTVDLVKDPTVSTNPETFYIAVGVNGNPENDKTVTVEFAVDGWYEGADASGTKVSESILKISQATTASTPPLGEKVSVDPSEDDTLVITHYAGLQKSKVLVGYSQIVWEANGPDAGDYSAKVTVTISEGQ